MTHLSTSQPPYTKPLPMLFIGYPITYQTAATLIGLPPNTHSEAIVDKYREFQIGIYYIYQNTCALGVTIHELTVPAGPFHEYDNGLEIIMAYKRFLMERIKKANLDLTSLEIVPARDQPPIVKYNPQPYIIHL